jgi:threonine dehydratase
VVEPSGAVPYAAVLDERLCLTGLRVGLIVSGGNVDLERLPWMRGTGAAA